MKTATLTACLISLTLYSDAARADEPVASEKTTPTVLPQSIQTNNSVSPGAVLAIFDRDGNNWSVAANQSSALNFVTTTHGNLLGVEVAAVEGPLRAHLDLQEKQGVVVASVPDDSEAWKAGLRLHDVIVQLNEDAIQSSEKFNDLIAALQGKEVKLHIVRQGKPTVLSVTLPNTPVYQLATEFANAQIRYELPNNQFRIGVTLAPADDALRSQVRLAQGEGLVVTEVVADSPAAKAGLMQHDLLTQLDGKRLTTVEACNAHIQEIKDRKVTVTLIRGGKELSIELSPQLSTATNLHFDVPTLSKISFNSRLQDTVLLTDLTNANPSVRWHVDSTLNAAQPNAQQQIAALKQQLAAMQQSLAALEASLQSAPRDNQPAPGQQPPASETDKK